MDRSALSWPPASRWGCFSADGFAFTSCCFYHEAPLAETGPDSLRRPLPDGITRTENCWTFIMGGVLPVMAVIIVVTGITGALHPPSDVETADPVIAHLSGEFVESNLGSAAGPDGSVTARVIAQQLLEFHAGGGRTLFSGWP
jgi:hypothetical protein